MLYEDEPIVRSRIVPLRGASYSTETNVHSDYTEEDFEAASPPITDDMVVDLRRELPRAETRAVIAARIDAARRLKYGDGGGRG